MNKMKRMGPMAVALIVATAGAALAQNSGKLVIQGGVKEENDQPTAQARQGAQAPTNDSIVKLVKAGLGEDTIVTMVNTQPGTYSLGADDIVALKKAGVSDKVISAVLTKGTNAPPSAPAGRSAASKAQTTPVAEIGVYYKKGEAWIEVMPEVVNWQTGGVIKSHVTLGVIKGDVNGRIDGQTSPNAVGTPAQFLVRLPEGDEITEYQFVHLHQHRDNREFRTVTGGVFHQSGGAKRDTLPFTYQKVAVRTYTVTLTQLGRGEEYGFLSPGAALSSHASAQLGKMYTFRVIE